MSFRHVLGVLDGGDDAVAEVLRAAVRVADADRSRLTLAATADPGHALRWLRPCAALALLTPMAELLCAEAELERIAGDRVARAAEFVPASIPVTTRVLGPDAARALRALLAAGAYDVLVAPACLLAHARRLNRDLRRLGVSVLALSGAPAQATADAASAAAKAVRPLPRG